MVIAHRLLLGLVLSVACGFVHSQTPNNDSAQPQRLFSIPYGREAGKVYVSVFIGGGEEGDSVFGPQSILVSPDAKRIALISARDCDTHQTCQEINLFNSNGMFIGKITYNSNRGYAPEYRLKPTEGFYIVDAHFGLNGLLYVRCEQMHIDATGRVQRIDVYDEQGARLESLSDQYTRALQGYPEAYRGTMVGTDNKGCIYIDMTDSFITIASNGTRGWKPKPFSALFSFLAGDTGRLYLVRRISPTGEPLVEELWSEKGQRFQKQTTVSLKDTAHAKHKYTSICPFAVHQSRSYWHASLAKSSRIEVRTPFGILKLYTFSVLVFDSGGRLTEEISYMAPLVEPVGTTNGLPRQFGVDSVGDVYVLRWTEIAIEVWRYAVGSRENKQ